MKNIQAPKLVLHCPSLCGSLSRSILPPASQVALVVKNLPAKEGYIREAGSILGSARSPGGGRGNPL